MNGTRNVEDISAETVPLVQRCRQPGCVYFIRTGDYVKIGFSTRPLDRLRSLQVSHPDKLEILCTIAGDIETERRMHRRFARLHVRGEWFRLASNLAEFIDRVTHPRPVLPEVTQLLKLRPRYGANSAIGRHISVLAEAIPNHHFAVDRDQKANLAAAIQRTKTALDLMMKAAA